MSTAQRLGFDTTMQHLQELVIWRLKNPDLSFDEAPQLDRKALPDSLLKQLIIVLELDAAEIAIVLLVLAPNLSPELLKFCVNQVFPDGGELPELGGIQGKNHRGILPTAETALFLIAGVNIEARVQSWQYFDKHSKLIANKIIQLEKPEKNEPKMSGALILDAEYTALLITGNIPEPELSIEFPASKIETQLTWDDLVLNAETRQEIRDLEIWLNHNETLQEKHNTISRFKQGYRVLFHGPPGTGKTLTASLLGKYTDREVYRIDLSTVVSKYIGETEKNLAKLFDKAQYKNWILFFDEADAIFGKRTQVRDAHDKYANQEVSYLLQRLEEHPGLVILASNFKNNIDAAFSRRFQALVYFAPPGYQERLELWKKTLPKKFKYAQEIDLKAIAKTYDITGAHITNVMHYCCLQALNQDSLTITSKNLTAGLKREYKKEEKMF